MQSPALYGLIGYPLGHSFSPGYFAEKFRREGIDAVYKAFPLPDVAQLPVLFGEHPNLQGLNVTIPHKESVIPWLDELDATAEAIGAVNCIKVKNGRTVGYNTDVTGFRQSLLPLLSAGIGKALILGTGGASKAVAYVLDELGIGYTYVSTRNKAGAMPYADVTTDVLAVHRLVINTTPLGMHPDVDTFPPLEYQAFTPAHLLYDLVYTPAKTLFLQKGAARGATVKNGLEMLHLQAEASWEIWNR